MEEVRKKPVWLKTASIAFVIVWLLVAAGPFLWTAWGSFKVQADFFSKSDWMNAIYGVKTLLETGSEFTGQGYFGAWIEQDFWLAAWRWCYVWW